MYCQHREKEGKDRLQETEKTMEEKTEQEIWLGVTPQ